MDFPDAATARRLVEQWQYQKAQLQFAQLGALIENAIKNGQTSISIESWLEAAVKSALEAKGYKVNSSSARNETYTTISW